VVKKILFLVATWLSLRSFCGPEDGDELEEEAAVCGADGRG